MADADVIVFVAPIQRAVHIVIAVRGRIRLTAQRRTAPLRTVTEQAVVAETIVGRIYAVITVLVAKIQSACHAVVAVRRRAGLTVQQGVTGFEAVAKQAVVTQAVVGRVRAGVASLVTDVNGAPDFVTAGLGAGPAVELWVARFAAIAEQTVVAKNVLGTIHAKVTVFIAQVDRAAHAVIAIRWNTRLTVQEPMACFRPITKQPIVTQTVIRRIRTRIISLIAGVVRTRDPVITGILSRPAAGNRVTRLCPVAEQAVVAQTVVRRTRAGVIGFVTGIVRARDPVVTRILSRLAIEHPVTRFSPIAILAVIAPAVVRRVYTGVIAFVARIDGAAHPIVAFRRRAGSTAE